MSYIGNQPADIGVYAVQSETGNGVLTAFTLDRAATNATVLISIDGVDQIPGVAFNVTVGTTLTFTSPPPNTSVISIRFLGDTVSFGEPSDDSVATAKIQDDAVTAAKLANSINTEIAANTAKVTNATHTGDVTGATALTIATDAVDIPMLSATGTADATTFLRGDNAWAAPAGGLFASYAVISDQKAQSAVQTSVTSGAFRVLDVNTEIADPDGIVSITSNRFSLGAGSYLIKALVSAYHGTNQVMRLYDYTNSAVVGFGMSTYLDSVHNFYQTLHSMSRVTPSGTTEYEIQRKTTGNSTPGSTSGFQVETYLYCEIYKES